jgi:lipopolysaccharide transport system ATP-binding protein
LLEVGTGFHPEMTARQNIYMNGSIMGMSRHEITSKLDEIVDFAGIERYLDTPVKRFSSGMTVRLGFAVAAFLEPEILVVDEVLAVGDAAFQEKCNNYFASLHGNQTVILVTHSMENVTKYCDRAILIDDGKIKDQGNPKKIANEYLKLWK